MLEFERELSPKIISGPGISWTEIFRDVFACEGISQEIRFEDYSGQNAPVSFFAKYYREGGHHYLQLQEFSNPQAEALLRNMFDEPGENIEPHGFRVKRKISVKE